MIAEIARSLGLLVTVIDPLPLPMERTLGARVARLVADLHRRNGVTALFGTGVDSIEHSGPQLTLRLSSGATLVQPATRWPCPG
jgi:phthalate 3,4-dioxygenase ferredoxin reductase subunit